MNTKEIYRLSTIIVYITIVFILVHCTSSQPLSTSRQKDDDTVDNSMKTGTLSDSAESNGLDTKNDDSIPEVYLLHSEYNLMKEPKPPEMNRRANFWKRANFWRKRANFWR
ncbi:unnamed protein product [Rotaria sp. Silwood1]|nr:unnamed protein product [Rotaria sp. Silwood1]CAF1360369.1 unnamed protein product [Rotaria sp. Silwood1]CAF1366481.1 unnamed protein product [Rotaria sp. Silwood1]CAF3543362.1 unnamed protein product [Rotaria sp. Silwood1]CAF3573564.1 unnamed protein product [Rotaria sp. Silwood1]